MSGPQLLMSGQEAMRAVAKILPTAHSLVVNSSFGPVELKPGTIWSGNKLLFDCGTMYVRYAIDDRIYEWNTSDFLRDEWFNAMAEGARRAAGMVILAKVEVALLTGIFVPWYLMLGMACAKVGLFYHHHKQLVDKAFEQAPIALELLGELRKRSPTLFNKLMLTAAKELLVNLPSGVTAEDVAFFVGRVIKGGAAAAPELTFGVLLKIVGRVAAIVTATHLPSIAGHAVADAAAKHAAELKQRLTEAGYSVTEAEARTILREVMSDRETVNKLQQLETACKALLPTLEALKRAYPGTF